MEACVCVHVGVYQCVFMRDRAREILCHHQTWKTSCPFLSGQNVGSLDRPLYIFLYIIYICVCVCVCECVRACECVRVYVCVCLHVG